MLDELAVLGAERDIRNVLFRYAKGVDRLDWALVRSCFHVDAVLTYGGPTSPEQFIAGASGGLAAYRFTQHSVSNILIEVDGAAARCESYCQARHRSPGQNGTVDTDFLWGGRYVDRFELREGAWRIAERVCVHDWTKLETVDAVWPAAASFTQGRRDRDDVSYG